MEGGQIPLRCEAGMVALEVRGAPCHPWPTGPWCPFHSAHALSHLLLVLRQMRDHSTPL